MLTMSALLLAGCGSVSEPETSAAGHDQFPISISNCGANISLEAAPQRIFVIDDSTLAILDSLDSLDLVTAMTNSPVPGIYPDETQKKIDALNVVDVSRNDTGGAVISLETVLAEKPDLVLSYPEAVDRDSLKDSNIAMYSSPAW